MSIGEEMGKRMRHWLSSWSGTRRSGDEALDPDEWVKLIHTRELAGAGRLPRYQDHAGISLAEFKRQRRKLRETEAACKPLLQAHAVIAAKDTNELVHAGDIEVTIPRSVFRTDVAVPIPPLGFVTGVPRWREGRIDNGMLWAKGGWRKRCANLEVTCASRERHAPELAAARDLLAKASAEDTAALVHVQESAFRAPVLFISHRWRSATHPDPEGETLARLLEIGDAYLIVDYCAFPQAPLASDEDERLQQLLARMGDLMHNVVVVKSADYLTRGWCVYEYLCACLKGTLVCDEIQDERFVELHRWACTEAPPPADLFRDGMSGLQANFIQESVLRCINQLLPRFKAAGYTLDADRSLVRGMLRDELQHTLPPRRMHNPYLGETLSKSWTADELERAFDSELHWDEMDTTPTQPFEVSVAGTLDEGRRRSFARTITRSSDWEMARAFSSVRSWFGADGAGRQGPDLGAMEA
jgi:hypothetical protein